MAQHITSKGGYGPGTFVDEAFTPVPEESRRLLKYFALATPGFTTDEAILDDVEFHGSDLPIIPGPLKSQVLSAVCHAMIGIVGKEISALRGIDTGKISIDTDKSGLYPATAGLVSIEGKELPEMRKENVIYRAGKDLEKGFMTKNHLHFRSWAIYPTKDPQVWYQILSNLNPPAFFKAYGLDPEAPAASRDEAYEILKAEITKYSAPELEQKNMENGFCGQTCFTPEHWRNTTMGKRLAAHPLINYNKVTGTPDLPPVPFPDSDDKRPLAGIRVIELARVIAAPAMGAALAALGAEIIKVQSPNLPDFQLLSTTLTAGKRTVSADLTTEEGKKTLQTLIESADVVIQAFRKGSLERKGFGVEKMVEMANKRGKGIVYVDLNCYGQDGYYAERPGFQQIADAASGAAYVCGKAYGCDEGVSVLPSLPIADMVAGAVGVIDTLLALRDRAKYGGSYHAAVALVSVDTVQLEEGVGLYPPAIIQKIQDTHKFGPMTPDLHVEELLATVVRAWRQSSDILSREGYMANFDTEWGKDHKILSPIVKYANTGASPHWTHGPVPYCTTDEIAWE